MTTGRGTRVGTGTPPRVPNGTARRAGWNTLDQRRSVPRGGGAGRPGRASGLEGGKRRVGTQGAVLGVTVGCRFGNARVHHRSGSGPAEDERPATTARRARGCNGDAGGAIAGASGGGVGRHGGGAGRNGGGAGRSRGGVGRNGGALGGIAGARGGIAGELGGSVGVQGGLVGARLMWKARVGDGRC